MTDINDQANAAMPNEPAVRAKLYSLFSADAMCDLEKWAPKNKRRWFINVQAFVGHQGTEGRDSFDFVACTPKWFVANFKDAPTVRHQPSELVRFGVSYVFLEAWDYDALVKAVEDLCQRSSGETWAAAANQLSRDIPWEFDYKHVGHVS